MGTKIKVSDVTHYYSSAKKQSMLALQNINLEVPENDLFVLVGPTGCGKSTLLGIISGLMKSSSGGISIDGEPITGPNPKKIAIMFQDSLLLPWQRVINNIDFALIPQHLDKAEREERAKKYLKMVGLQDFMDAYPHQLSGGMKQRTALARALSTQSDVLLMDEPFGALDEQTRLVLADELVNIWQQLKITIVFVTHSLIEAVYLGQRIGVMSFRPGRLKLIVDVNLPRPRDIGTPNFDKIYKQLKDEIRGESMKGM